MTSNQVLFNSHHVVCVLLTGIIVLGRVLLHYEVFSWLTRVLANLHLRIRRRRILLLILGLHDAACD